MPDTSDHDAPTYVITMGDMRTMPAAKRQTNTDTPPLTRAEVAKRLGRDISWVRRREGRDLHPALRDGINHFDPEEVEQLRARLEAEDTAARAADEVVDLIHRAFEHHAGGVRHTLDSIATQTGLETRAIKRMHAIWTETQLSIGRRPPPALLSRAELLAKDQREALEIERYYDEFSLRCEREWEEDRLRGRMACPGTATLTQKRKPARRQNT
ncbi:MAG: hypothetical protein EOO73_29330 [Myxococcales bacterium]|nr:MAG: hypothetical protein EOO73_29330 [Myxococcales bacterium]